VAAAKLRSELKHDTLTWVHLDYSVEGIQEWLREVANLDDVVVEALTAEEPRPRCAPHHGGVILILRSVNQNPGQDREDMVSIRIWLDQHGLISMRQRRLVSPGEVKELLEAGRGPCDQGELIVTLSNLMCDRIAEVVGNLEETMDDLEGAVTAMETQALRARLAEMRRESIMIRRYLAPQRDALATLLAMRFDWLREGNLVRMREVADRTMRYVEDLDAIRERAMVTQEELTNRSAERMNRTMYFLSLVTGIFLPLGLLTGLLGINVGGMPGADDPRAFWMVCGFLAGIVMVQVWLLKRIKWL